MDSKHGIWKFKKTKSEGFFLLLFVIAFITFIDGMDGSIVNVALPKLAIAMHTDTGTISWITIVYFMMMAGLILVFGRIAYNGAIKKIVIIGFIMFLISSILCGLSVNFLMMVISRVMQGISAAMLAAAAPMMCVRYLPENRLGMGLGISTLGYSIGYTIGPALGGFILDVLSWHWVFFINVPLILIVMPIVLKAVKADEKKTHIPLDTVGAVTFFTMVISGIYALERCCYPGEGLACTISMAIFVLSLYIFIKNESKMKNPLINIQAFRNRRFNLVFIAYVFINLIYLGLWYLIPFYMDLCLNLSSSVSGMFLLVPSAVTLLLVVPLSKKSDALGRRSFSIAACGVMAISMATWCIAAPLKSIHLIIVALALMGVSWALYGGAMSSRVIEEIADESHEMGSSIMNEGTYIGCAAGTAAYAAMFVFYTDSGNTNFSDLSPDVFLSGFVFVLVVSVIMSIAITIISAAVKDKPKSAPL